MTADDHLKNAASELAKAAQTIQQDISQLRTDESNVKQSINLQLTQLNDELKVVQQQQNQTTEPDQKQRLQQRINDVQNQIADKRRELSMETRRVADFINQKQKDATAIEQQARHVAPS